MVAMIESKVGDRIDAGDTVMFIEFMKMQIPVLVEEAGTLRRSWSQQGDTVSEGQVVAMLESRWRRAGGASVNDQPKPPAASGRDAEIEELRLRRGRGVEARRRRSRRQAPRAGPPHDPRAHRRAGRRRLLPGGRRAHRPGPLCRRQARRRDAGALRHGARRHRRPPGRRRRRGFHGARRHQLVRRPQEGRPGRLHRGPGRQLSHSARQPDRRLRRQRHVASTGAAMRSSRACTASSARWS